MGSVTDRGATKQEIPRLGRPIAGLS